MMTMDIVYERTVLSTNKLQRGETQETTSYQHQQQQRKLCLFLCLPLLKHSKSQKPNSVSSALRELCDWFSCRSRFKTAIYDFVVVNNAVFYGFIDSRNMAGGSIDEGRGDVSQMGTFADLLEEDKLGSSSSSEFLTSEATGPEEEEEEVEEEEETYGISEAASSSSSFSMRKPEADVPPLDCSSDNGAAEVANSKRTFDAQKQETTV